MIWVPKFYYLSGVNQWKRSKQLSRFLCKQWIPAVVSRRSKFSVKFSSKIIRYKNWGADLQRDKFWLVFGRIMYIFLLCLGLIFFWVCLESRLENFFGSTCSISQWRMLFYINQSSRIGLNFYIAFVFYDWSNRSPINWWNCWNWIKKKHLKNHGKT
jgi:hypothetical protein